MMNLRVAAAAVLALATVYASPAGAAGGRSDLLREVLRQQSAAERSVCGAVREAVQGGSDVEEVVRVAVGLGFSSCEVVRCALEGGADLSTVLEAAAGAGTPAEVLSRCAVESGAAPDQVAAVLNEISLDPSFCYFDPELRGAPPVVPPYGGGDRQYQRVEFSPFLP